MKLRIHQKIFQIIKPLFLSLLFDIQPSTIRVEGIKNFDFSKRVVLLIDCLSSGLCNDAGSSTKYFVAALNVIRNNHVLILFKMVRAELKVVIQHSSCVTEENVVYDNG
jgi:hypothetical protein